MPVAIGPSELSVLLLVLCLVAIPVAAVAFARSGAGLKELGKGRFAVDREEPRAAGSPPAEIDPAEHEEEVRQMAEAAAWRRRARGETDGDPGDADELDVQAEIDRVLGTGGPHPRPDTPEEPGPADPAEPQPEGGIREEIRQLVVANNERRERRGEDPLDVDSEVERRLREWT